MDGILLLMIKGKMPEALFFSFLCLDNQSGVHPHTKGSICLDGALGVLSLEIRGVNAPSKHVQPASEGGRYE